MADAGMFGVDALVVRSHDIYNGDELNIEEGSRFCRLLDEDHRLLRLCYLSGGDGVLGHLVLSRAGWQLPVEYMAEGQEDVPGKKELESCGRGVWTD